jgi:hypothetical protein
METFTEDTYSITFNSVFALSDHIEANKHDITESAPFNEPARMSMEEARKRAMEGGRWPEGAEHIKPAEIALGDFMIHDMHLPRPENAVVGYRPNVPAYLAGSPASMVRMTATSQPNRLLKVAVHVGKSFNVTDETTFNRGNGILSCLNALATAGFAIELWAVWRNSSNGNQVSIDTLIKDSTDTYSPDSIAFALCNDGFQRRLAWSCLAIAQEQQKALKDAGKPYSTAPRELAENGYGNGRSAEFDDFDISFGYVVPTARWTRENSTDKARKVVEAALSAKAAS